MLIVKNNILTIGLFTLMAALLSFFSILVVTLGEKYGGLFSIIIVSLYTLIVTMLYYVCGKTFVESDGLSIYLKVLSTVSITIILYISIMIERDGFSLFLMPFFPACTLLQNLLDISIGRMQSIFAVISYLSFLIGVIVQA